MSLKPEIGNWYLVGENDDQFEVVAINDDGESIDVQFFDGEIEEFDRDTWNALELKNCPPPEDWSGPFEIDSNELDSTEESMKPDNVGNPVNEIDSIEDEIIF